MLLILTVLEPEHVSEEIRHSIGNENIQTNIIRIKAINSIMCRYFCIGFIDYMLAGETLTDYTSLFSLHDFKRNDKITLDYIKNGRSTQYTSQFKR